MVFAAAVFIIGIFLIVKGGDLFVDAAGRIARATGIPPFIIGATIVSIATTAPELFVSVISITEGSVGLSTGNAIGSVICNTGFILALSIFFMPVKVNAVEITQKGLLLLSSVLALMAFSYNGNISLSESMFLYGLLIVFIWLNIRSVSDAENRGKEDVRKIKLRVTLLKFLLGAVGVVFGAHLLVDSGIRIAIMLGVSDRIIGLTIVAAGTSLPELVTTVTAIVKKQSSLSVGNIIGANVIDLTLILSTCAIVTGSGFMVPANIVLIDLPVCLLLLVIAVFPAVFSGRFYRIQGVLMMAVYLFYLFLIFII